jgi:hypothetical protein
VVPNTAVQEEVNLEGGEETSDGELTDEDELAFKPAPDDSASVCSNDSHSSQRDPDWTPPMDTPEDSD